MNWVLMMKQIV